MHLWQQCMVWGMGAGERWGSGFCEGRPGGTGSVQPPDMGLIVRSCIFKQELAGRERTELSWGGCLPSMYKV